MLRSLGFGLGLETFAKFLMISVSVSKNLVSEKKYRFRFRKIWYRKRGLGFGIGKFGLEKKSIGFGFEKFWSRKKVSVSVSENLVLEKSLGFGKFGIAKKSLGIGFGQNFGIVIQWCTTVHS